MRERRTCAFDIKSVRWIRLCHQFYRTADLWGLLQRVRTPV